MTRAEIIKEIEYLEARLLKADEYFNTLSDEEIENIEETKEYAVMKKIIYRLNALYGDLKSCVYV